MATFIYSGPPSGATLQLGVETQEVLFWPGGEVELPVDHPYVKTMMALGHLTLVKTSSPSASGKTFTRQNGNNQGGNADVS